MLIRNLPYERSDGRPAKIIQFREEQNYIRKVKKEEAHVPTNIDFLIL
jgi:hypothetical protein